MTTLTKRIDFSEPHVLRTEEEYDAAVAELDALLDRDPTPGTREHKRLQLLSVLVRAYDEDHYPIGAAATPQAVVDFLLEQRGMTRAEPARLSRRAQPSVRVLRREAKPLAGANPEAARAVQRSRRRV